MSLYEVIDNHPIVTLFVAVGFLNLVRVLIRGYSPYPPSN